MAVTKHGTSQLAEPMLMHEVLWSRHQTTEMCHVARDTSQLATDIDVPVAVATATHQNESVLTSHACETKNDKK